MNIKRLLYKIAALFYFTFLLWQLFLGPFRSYSLIRHYNFYPLKTIFDFFSHFNYKRINPFIINIVGNIVVFIPMGFFIAMFLIKGRDIKKLVLLTIVIVSFVEIMQFVLNVGVCDVDDLILNVIGCLIGEYLCSIINKENLRRVQ